MLEKNEHANARTTTVHADPFAVARVTGLVFFRRLHPILQVVSFTM